jgi:membrane protein required for colicin V production
MNSADWAIVVILALSSLISLARGFIKEAFSLVIWIAALVLANVFSHRLEPIFAPLITTPSLRAMTAFITIFIGVLLVGALINYGVGLLIKMTGLSSTDRLIGVIFGFVRGLFIIMILLIYVPEYVPVKNDAWFKESELIPYFARYEKAMKNITGEITHLVVGLVTQPQKTTI